MDYSIEYPWGIQTWKIGKTMEELFWFRCPECDGTWGSENPSANREWCTGCYSALEPELIYESEAND